jgi:hypothetical protein
MSGWEIDDPEEQYDRLHAMDHPSRDTEIERIAGAIDAVVNAPGSGVWIDYSHEANRGTIPASRLSFAAALYDAGLRSQPADNEAGE